MKLTTASSQATLFLCFALVVAVLVSNWLVQHPLWGCAECGKAFRCTPIVPDHDRRATRRTPVFCSPECFDAAAEKAGTSYLNEGRS